MYYTKPEGCQAAIVSSWKTAPPTFFTSGKHELTTQLMCGERNNTVFDGTPRGFMDVNGAFNRSQVERRVGLQVTEILGAVCLGCPNRKDPADNN